MGIRERKRIQNLRKFAVGTEPTSGPTARFQFDANGMYNWHRYGGVRINEKGDNSAYFKKPHGLSYSKVSDHDYINYYLNNQNSPILQSVISNLQPKATPQTPGIDLEYRINNMQHFNPAPILQSVLQPKPTSQKAIDLQANGALNHQKLPKIKSGTGIANLAATGVGHIANSITFANSAASPEQLNAEAGTQQRQFMGVGYTQQNINNGKSLKQYDQSGVLNSVNQAAQEAAAGAPLGPIGAVAGAVGGLVSGLIGWGVGHNKYKKALQQQREMAFSRTQMGRSSAGTTALTNEYYNNYGNTQGGVWLT